MIGEKIIIEILIKMIRINLKKYTDKERFDLYLKLDTLADTVKHYLMGESYLKAVSIILKNFDYFSTTSGRKVPWSCVESEIGKERPEEKESE